MNKHLYYHNYPACPACHEPHFMGINIEIMGENKYYCLNCGTQFRRKIDLLSLPNFKAIVNKKKILKNIEPLLGDFKLFWNVQPNIIEQSFIVWIKNIKSGNYLITWPWYTVKIIPILILEYYFQNPENRIVVIGNVSKDRTENTKIISAPAIDECFASLFFNKECNNINEVEYKKKRKQIIKGLKKLKTSIVYKEKVTNITIKRKGERREILNQISRHSIVKTKKKILKEIMEEENTDAICVKTKTLKRKTWIIDKKFNNIKSNIDIKLEEINKWTGDIKYPKDFLITTLLNWDKLIPANSIENTIVSADQTKIRNIEKKKVFFISEYKEIHEIFDLIQEIKPELVIIANTDRFIKDIRFRGEKSYTLHNYLKTTNIPVLMFSCDQDLRHLYSIKIENQHFDESIGAIKLTIDSSNIVDIAIKKSDVESKYPNPLSSKLSLLTTNKENIKIKYQILPELNISDQILKMILCVTQDLDIIRSTRFFIHGLTRSLLNFLEVTIKDINYFKLLNSVLSELVETNYEIVDDISLNILKVYRSETKEDRNPLREKVILLTKNILHNPKYAVTIIVNPMEVKRTKNHLDKLDMNYEIDDMSRLQVCSWSRLSKREVYIGIEKLSHVVIATVYPSIRYSLYSSSIEQLIFIGSEKNIKNIKRIIDFRLNEYFTRPYHELVDTEDSPPILREIQQKINLNEDPELMESYEEILIDFSEKINIIDIQGSGSQYTSDFDGDFIKDIDFSNCLEKGEKSFLVINNENEGMFIPEDTILILKTVNGQIEECKINLKIEKQEILIDKSGLYLSSKGIFIKNMLIYGSRVQFIRGIRKWNGFKELYKDSVKWINILKETCNLLAKNNNIDMNKAENKLAKFLSNLNLHARNPDYIRTWWSKFEIIDFSQGNFYLYNVETPKSPTDIKKIYQGLKTEFPELKLDEEELLRSYSSARFIQKMRIDLLKNRRNNYPSGLQFLYDRLQSELAEIIGESTTFTPKIVYRVEITEEVEPLRVLTNYLQFCKNI